jgi:hypothetical protein
VAYRKVASATYRSGTGVGGLFWLLAACVAVVVAFSTSGVVSYLFWGIAGLLLMMALALLLAYATGHGRGGWTSDGIESPSGES